MNIPVFPPIVHPFVAGHVVVIAVVLAWCIVPFDLNYVCYSRCSMMVVRVPMVSLYALDSDRYY